MSGSDFEDFGAIATRVVDKVKANPATAAEVEAYERGLAESERENRWRMLQAVGVPARTRDTLATAEATSALERVRRWATSDRSAWCLVVSGRPGCGKSTAAAWWLFQSVHPDIAARRWWPSTLIMTCDRYKGELEGAAAGGPLVIDDLGTEYADRSGNFTERLDYVLTEREAEYRRTLITTNLSAQAFAERYSDRILSRLAGAAPLGGFYEDVGPDMRRI